MEKLLDAFMLLVIKYFGVEKENFTYGLFALAGKTDNLHVKRFPYLYGSVVYRDLHLTKDQVAELKQNPRFDQETRQADSFFKKA